MPVSGTEIQENILFRKINGLGRTVHRMYRAGPSFKRIHRESSCIAKHVKYIFSPHVVQQQLPVIALINEETCFLSRNHINPEFVPIFNNLSNSLIACKEFIFSIESGFARDRIF